MADVEGSEETIITGTTQFNDRVRRQPESFSDLASALYMCWYEPVFLWLGYVCSTSESLCPWFLQLIEALYFSFAAERFAIHGNKYKYSRCTSPL